MGLMKFYRSPLGKKAVMAVTGLILFGFVLGHMVGNLKLYKGQNEAGEYALDVYAHHLRTLGEPILGHGEFLWIARIGLLLAVLLHIHAAISLTLLNKAARPQNYVKREKMPIDYATYTMRWGGVLILFYIIYHLLHLTVGSAHHDFQAGAVHHNVVTGFQQPMVSLVYIVANLLLGLHLYHGLWSLFQSLGWSGPRFNPLRRRFAQVFAVVITLGNLSFPLAVLTGMVS